MPGLIRGVARTAVVAGTATAVSNGVSRKQAQRWAKQGPPVQSPYSYQVQAAPQPQYVQQAPAPQPQYVQQAPAPQPQYVQEAPAPEELPAPEPDLVGRIQKLADLHRAGLITDAEFAEQKERILQEV